MIIAVAKNDEKRNNHVIVLAALNSASRHWSMEIQPAFFSFSHSNFAITVIIIFIVILVYCHNTRTVKGEKVSRRYLMAPKINAAQRWNNNQ